MTPSSKKNYKALANLNDKLLSIMNGRCILAPYLLSVFSKNTNPDHTSQYDLVKDPDAKKVNDLLLKKKQNLFLFLTIC